MVFCCVVGCANQYEKDSGITFHNFPREPARREEWMRNVRRKNWQPSRWTKICSIHFEHHYVDRTSLSCVRLRENAVPTLFLLPPKQLQKKTVKSKKSPVIQKVSGTPKNENKSSSNDVILDIIDEIISNNEYVLKEKTSPKRRWDEHRNKNVAPTLFSSYLNHLKKKAVKPSTNDPTIEKVSTILKTDKNCSPTEGIQGTYISIEEEMKERALTNRIMYAIDDNMVPNLPQLHTQDVQKMSLKANKLPTIGNVAGTLKNDENCTLDDVVQDLIQELVLKIEEETKEKASMKRTLDELYDKNAVHSQFPSCLDHLKKNAVMPIKGPNILKVLAVPKTDICALKNAIYSARNHELIQNTFVCKEKGFLKRKVDKLDGQLHRTNRKLCESRKKIKTLLQARRRLLKINTRLHDVILDLKSKEVKNCMDPISSLENAISPISVDLLKTQMAKKKGSILHIDSGYCDETRAFAMTLHFCSSDAYDFVRKSFDSCLPHPKTVERWFQEELQRKTLNSEDNVAVEME